MSNGTKEKTDVILWNIGFRGALAHLRSVLAEKTGAIIMAGALATMVAKQHRSHLPEYGSSASMIGVDRSESAATRELMAILGWPKGYQLEMLLEVIPQQPLSARKRRIHKFPTKN